MEGHRIDIGGISVEVVRKDIKNLHVGVYPPSGRVRVAAPLRLDDDAVRLAVISRIGWIRRKRLEFEQQDRQSQREFVTGESHYFRGRRYRLKVIAHDGRPGVQVLNNATLGLRICPGDNRGCPGSDTSSLVSPPTPRPIASIARQMGTKNRCEGRRGSH